MKLVKDKTRLTFKIFIIVWSVLFLQVILKLTFNYWQPYVIPNEQLLWLSNFIDSNYWLKLSLDFILYVINALFVILASISKWWFKNTRETIITFILIIVGFIISVLIPEFVFYALFLTIIFPIILDRTKWLYAIITFALSNVFLLLSLWLTGFITSNDMNYFVKVFFELDYYIMLVLNYVLFNFIRERKEIK